MVGDVDQRVDPFEMDEVTLDPFTKSKILNINMACMRRGFLSIAHRHTTVVVLVCNGGSFLWDIEVPEDTTDREGHSAEVACGHKFSLCQREGNCWLKYGLVGNCAALLNPFSQSLLAGGGVGQASAM